MVSTLSYLDREVAAGAVGCSELLLTVKVTELQATCGRDWGRWGNAVGLRLDCLMLHALSNQLSEPRFIDCRCSATPNQVLRPAQGKFGAGQG